MKTTPRIPWAIFQPVVEAGMAKNSLSPMPMATNPNRMAIAVTDSRLRRRMMSEIQSQMIPVMRKSHQMRDAPSASSVSSRRTFGTTTSLGEQSDLNLRPIDPFSSRPAFAWP